VALGHAGMVKIVLGIAGHAQLLHHANGAEVLGRGEGDEFRQCKCVKGVIEDGQGAFSGEAVAPVVRIEAPADFDRRRKVRLKGRNGEADVTEELAGSAEFGGPEAEAVLCEVSLDAEDRGVGL